jgi:apolipoprotein N-acyltransferase
LAFFCLIALAVAIQYQSPKRVFLLGWSYGLALGLASFSWLETVMAGYGGLGQGGVLVLIALAAYLAVYQGLWALLMAPLINAATSPSVARFFSLRQPCLVALIGAGLWVGLDHLKNWVFTGFNWSPLAMGLALEPRLMGLADVLGLYGLGLVVAAINGFLFFGLGFFRKTPKKRSYPFFALALLLFGVIWFYGQKTYAHWEKIAQTGPVKKIALLQASVDQEMKWDTAYRDLILARYDLLFQKALKANPWLIVWSETAAPFAYGHDALETSWLNGLLRLSSAPSLVGVTFLDTSATPNRLLNRAWLMGSSGPGAYYDKQHLVPFGEFVPMMEELPFLKWPIFQAIIGASGAFSPGQPSPPLIHDGTRLGVMICFESIFPPMARQRVLEGSQLLAITTNDAWFGASWAPEQHLYHAVWRAAENRRPLIRAANNGVSALISPSGRIIQRSTQNEVETYIYPLHLLPLDHLKPTFYALYGHWLAPLLAWAAALMTIVKGLTHLGRARGWFRRAS